MTPVVATARILVVDDDPAIRHLITRFLRFNNYEVEAAETAAIAREKFHLFVPNLVILDVNLPDDSGFKLCNEMRSPRTLVLMLTCLSDKDYVLTGFERGADEYLTKPFDLEVLKAKIGALLKRQQQTTTPAPPPPDPNKFTIGEITIDHELLKVTRKQQIIPLTLLEYELFYFLMTHPEKIWGRQELIAEVWGDQQLDTTARKVDVHIGQIRRKLGEPENECIRTIRGKGYIFEPHLNLTTNNNG